jgi:hypothetical protein
MQRRFSIAFVVCCIIGWIIFYVVAPVTSGNVGVAFAYLVPLLIGLLTLKGFQATYDSAEDCDAKKLPKELPGGGSE